jgi:hypothetical protein
MPTVVDYPQVLTRLESEGFVCNYPNGGSFGFPPEVGAQIRGWIGPTDSTIRPSVQPVTRRIADPLGPTLARLATQAWVQFLSGGLWLMPSSHWSHELHHGNKDWLTPALQSIGMDSADLAHRTNAAALQFLPAESAILCQFLQQVLEQIHASDFQLVFPGQSTTCTIHHHKQLWWTTANANLLRGLDALAR